MRTIFELTYWFAWCMLIEHTIVSDIYKSTILSKDVLVGPDNNLTLAGDIEAAAILLLCLMTASMVKGWIVVHIWPTDTAVSLEDVFK